MLLRIFAFAPAFGRKTPDPFALRLLTWCDLHGIAYDLRAEDNASKQA